MDWRGERLKLTLAQSNTGEDGRILDDDYVRKCQYYNTLWWNIGFNRWFSTTPSLAHACSGMLVLVCICLDVLWLWILPPYFGDYYYADKEESTLRLNVVCVRS